MKSTRPLSAVPETLLFVGVADRVRCELMGMAGLESLVLKVETFLEAEARLLSIGEACLIVPVPSDASDPWLEQFRRLRARFPHSSVLALFAPESSAHHALLQLGTLGVTDMLVLSGKLSMSAFQHALVRCHCDTLTSRIRNVFDEPLKDAFETLLMVALRHAHGRLDTSRLAVLSGMHERTLRKLCEAEDIPSPQWVIGWARLLVAAYYLEEPGRSIAQTAEFLEFPSACALRNQFQRYTGHSTQLLRSLGATRAVFHAMVDSIGRHAVSIGSGPTVLRILHK